MYKDINRYGINLRGQSLQGVTSRNHGSTDASGNGSTGGAAAGVQVEVVSRDVSEGSRFALQSEGGTGGYAR